MPIRKYHVRIARTLSDWQSAMELTYGEYVKAGLIDRNSIGLRSTESDLWPGTQKLLSSISGNVLGTLTMIVDSIDHGLPMDTVYEAELVALRQSGRKLVELSALAMDVPDLRGSLPVQVSLFALMYHYALQQGVSDLVIAVHPKHAPFYEKAFGFLRIGTKKPYPYANEHPAVALRHDVRHWMVHWQELRFGNDILHGHTFSREELCPATLSVEEKMERFGKAIECSSAQYVPN